MDWLAPYVKIVAVKNFVWTSEEKEDHTAWTAKVGPVRQGVAPWPEVLRLLKQMGYDGYYSVFGEYWELCSFRQMNLPEMVNQVRQDVEYLKGLYDALWGAP